MDKNERPDWDKQRVDDVGHLHRAHQFAKSACNVQYDITAGEIEGAPSFRTLGENVYMQHEDVLPGEVQLYRQSYRHAHVRNLGFVQAVHYAWYLENKHVGRNVDKPLEVRKRPSGSAFVGEVFTAPLSHNDQRESPRINNDVTDPLWAWHFSYVVNNAVSRRAINSHRYGTFL